MAISADSSPNFQDEDFGNWVTQKQLAAHLQISERTLERMRSDGTGPRFAKVGRRVLYNLAAVAEWLSDQSFESTAEARRRVAPGA